MSSDSASHSEETTGVEYELLAMRSRALSVFVLVACLGIAVAGICNPWRLPKESPLPESYVIDLNTATTAELELLPGVGDKMAGDIVRYRSERGGFKAIEELKKIRGIKDGRFRALEPHLKIEHSPIASDAKDQAGPSL